MAKFQFKYVYYLLIKLSTAAFVTLCHCEIEFKGFLPNRASPSHSRMAAIMVVIEMRLMTKTKVKFLLRSAL